MRAELAGSAPACVTKYSSLYSTPDCQSGFFSHPPVRIPLQGNCQAAKLRHIAGFGTPALHNPDCTVCMMVVDDSIGNSLERHLSC
jgi:hypothetical protein